MASISDNRLKHRFLCGCCRCHTAPSAKLTHTHLIEIGKKSLINSFIKSTQIFRNDQKDLIYTSMNELEKGYPEKNQDLNTLYDFFSKQVSSNNVGNENRFKQGLRNHIISPFKILCEGYGYIFDSEATVGTIII